MGQHHDTAGRHSPEHAGSRREKYFFRGAGVVAGLGVLALAGLAVDEGVRAWDSHHPPTPQGQRVITSASSGPAPVSSADSAPAPSVSPDTSSVRPSAAETALGTPLSYTLHMKDGGVKKVRLLPMSCPPDCERKPVPGHPNAISVKLIPPENYEGWRNVYYYTADPRLILAHSTEVPANAGYFAGQYFVDIKKGDKLELETSTGEHDYVAESIAVPSKGTLDFNKSVQALGKDDLLFTTCAVPNDNYNVLIEFVPATAGPESATSTRLGAAAMSSPVLS